MNRRPITSRMHAMLDYPLGVVLILSPWIFGFSDVGGAAVTVPIVMGALAIVQSLVTDRGVTAAGVFPPPVHLMTDVAAGIVLAASPFVLGFADEGTNAWLPHAVFGGGPLGAGLMTQRVRETPRDVRGRRSTGPATR